MSLDQTSWVVLAHLLRPQGRKGEVLAELLTDFPERFQPSAKVFLAPPGFSGPAVEARQIEVASAWLPQGRNQGRIVLCFREVGSINDATRLAGLDVVVPTFDRTPLTDDSIYIDDLLGCTLYDQDASVGVVRKVEFAATPDGKRRLMDAAPLLTVELPGGEALVPFVKPFLVRIDPVRKELWMKLPQGLIEINQEQQTPKSAVRNQSRR